MVFDQLKKIAELKKFQDSLKKEKVVVERNGITIEMNGEFAVEDIKLNPDLVIEKQQEFLKQCLNEARQEIQKKMAKSLMSAGIGF